MKGALSVALVLATLALAAATAPADGVGPEVTITSPEEGVTIAQDTVTVRATFAASAEGAVEQVDFVVDDVCVDARVFESGQGSGSVAFIWAARKYDPGNHTLAVRAADSQGGAGEATISISLHRDPPLERGITITSPARGAGVSGTTTVTAELDESIVARYVIFLVDDVFKAMSNVPPFTYTWDTTRYLNGLHTLTAKAYLEGGRECLSPPVEVRIENPGRAASGRTPRMKTEATVAAAPIEPPSRAGQPTLPGPKHTASATTTRPPLTISEPELAIPGTAPFITSSGELIRPSASLPFNARAVSPIQAAPIPADAPAQVGPTPAVSPPSPSPAAQPITPATSECAPEAASGAPQPAPVTIAALPEPVPSAPVRPALHSATELRIAALPPAEMQRTAPTEPMASDVRVAMDPPTPEPATAAPGPSEQIEVSMLPPRPAERLPSPRLTAAPAPADVVYVVQSGDWLRQIADEFGVTPEEIAAANNLADPNLIHPGQRLRIPSTPVYYGSELLITEVPTVLDRGRAIVQFRPVIEEAGGTVTWSAAERSASAVARGHQLAVTIDSDRAELDGGTVTMSSPAALRCNRTVVPMRFLGDALDLALQYRDGIIHIASRR